MQWFESAEKGKSRSRSPEKRKDKRHKGKKDKKRKKRKSTSSEESDVVSSESSYSEPWRAFMPQKFTNWNDRILNDDFNR